MTLIELITVLAIFAVLSSVAIFNYGSFQAKIDLTNLANDIALQVVGAQKASLNGLLPTKIPTVSPWKPSYGVYFSSTGTPDAIGADNKDFVYFTDLNNSKLFDGSVIGSSCTQECLSKYTISKNDYISDISVFYLANPSTPNPVANLTTVFSRPDSGAVLHSGNNPNPLTGVSYVQLTITNGKNPASFIKLYPSGRVQLN